MNNFEKIKNMTIYEMAEFICHKVMATYCEYCSFKEDCEDTEYTSCKSYVRYWLQQESEE